MKARDLIELLNIKHAKDIFITECKNGSSTNGHLRLDGWAMKKSWASPLVTGYEVKVSRSDFLGDDKWQGYLQYCNELYFVCPSGLIRPEELPKEVGLLWASKTGTRLYTKKKAVYRLDGLNMEEVYKYILLWRATVSRHCNTYNCESTGREYWEDWLAKRAEDKRLGFRVSRKIRQIVTEQIENVTRENERLRRENERLSYIKDELEKFGFKDHVPEKWLFEERVKDMQRLIPDDVRRSLRWLNKRLTETLEIIEKAEVK